MRHALEKLLAGLAEANSIYLNIFRNSYLIIIRKELMEQDQAELQAARDKLAARFANATQIGGKGKGLCAPTL
jgi:hypothetical protein